MKIFLVTALTLCVVGCIDRGNLPFTVEAKYQEGSQCSVVMRSSSDTQGGVKWLQTNYKEEYCSYNVGDVIK